MISNAGPARSLFVVVKSRSEQPLWIKAFPTDFGQLRRFGLRLIRKIGVLAAALSVLCVCFALAANGADTTTASHAPKHTSVSKAKTHHASTATGKSRSSLHKGTRSGKKSRRVARGRSRGQQKIDSQRAEQIQEALIREHYLSGEPSGVWDDATQKALQKYQADNGWQSKTVPDARALIKLGLGPNHDHLLNPESAMTSTPQAQHNPTNDPLAGTSPANQPQNK
jgi:hypothetical protein